MRIDLARTGDAQTLVESLTAAGIHAWTDAIDSLAVQVGERTGDVGHAIEDWIATHHLPFIPFAVEHGYAVAPPAG
jgi:hypothetical protein